MCFHLSAWYPGVEVIVMLYADFVALGKLHFDSKIVERTITRLDPFISLNKSSVIDTKKQSEN